MSALRITPIPSLRDNYAYLLTCGATGQSAVVDPSEADKVEAALDLVGAELSAIFNTHHHWDHTGGNKALLQRRPDLRVVGHVSDAGRIPGLTEMVDDGDSVALGDTRAAIRHIPGHTTGAIAFCFDEDVFTGDTLFNSGCGRLFEGTPAMMYRSLRRLVEELPPSTRVWNGHEYTVQSLRFAKEAEPDNAAVAARYDWASAEREAGRFTLPSTIQDELDTNPFVRAGSAERLGELRSWKDTF